jgi:MinD-like ATPase involved in chromosome partitioning or flagellar assembly
MVDTRIIRISSEKGGVGKTVIAINLAVALQMSGHKTLLVDAADPAMPSVGVYMGLPKPKAYFTDVLFKNANPDDAISTHDPTDLKVIQGTPVENYIIGADEVKKISTGITAMQKYGFEYIIVDTQPEVHPDNIGTLYTDAIIITVPEVVACEAAADAAKRFNTIGIRHSIVVNRAQKKGYELDQRDIENYCDDTPLVTMPEDEIVPKSIAEHIPAYMLNKNSPFCKRIAELAEKM